MGLLEVLALAYAILWTAGYSAIGIAFVRTNEFVNARKAFAWTVPVGLAGVIVWLMPDVTWPRIWAGSFVGFLVVFLAGAATRWAAKHEKDHSALASTPSATTSPASRLRVETDLLAAPTDVSEVDAVATYTNLANEVLTNSSISALRGNLSWSKDHFVYAMRCRIINNGSAPLTDVSFDLELVSNKAWQGTVDLASGVHRRCPIFIRSQIDPGKEHAHTFWIINQSSDLLSVFWPASITSKDVLTGETNTAAIERGTLGGLNLIQPPIPIPKTPRKSTK